MGIRKSKPEAAKVRPTQFKAWSYSLYASYTYGCPFQVKCERLDKLPAPKSAPMQRGIEIHKTIEDWLLAPRGAVPAVIDKALHPYMRACKKEKGEVEKEWAFTKLWKPTGWFEKDTWFRMKVDHLKEQGDTLRMRDWKTGKLRENKLNQYTEQLEIYGVIGLMTMPHINKVYGELAFTDAGEMLDEEDIPEASVERSQLKGLIAKWTKAPRALLADRRFVPKPSYLCGYCHFSKAKGGPCKF